MYLIYLLKEAAFSFVDFCCSLLFLFSFISALILMISSLLLTLEFFVSSFSSCFRCKVRLFDFSFVSWGKLVLLWNFPLALFYWLPQVWGCVSFSFLSMHILISSMISSVICWFFRSVLFSLNMFVFLIVFSCNWYLILPHCDQKRWWKWFNFLFF